MKVTLTTNKEIVTRGKCRCHWCDEWIQPGELAQFMAWDVVTDWNEREHPSIYLHEYCVGVCLENGGIKMGELV